MKKLADFCRNFYWILIVIIGIPTVIIDAVLLVEVSKNLKMESIEDFDEDINEE